MLGTVEILHNGFRAKVPMYHLPDCGRPQDNQCRGRGFVVAVTLLPFVSFDRILPR